MFFLYDNTVDNNNSQNNNNNARFKKLTKLYLAFNNIVEWIDDVDDDNTDDKNMLLMLYNGLTVLDLSCNDMETINGDLIKDINHIQINGNRFDNNTISKLRKSGIFIEYNKNRCFFDNPKSKHRSSMFDIAGGSSMQGFRPSMEDYHVICPNFLSVNEAEEENDIINDNSNSNYFVSSQPQQHLFAILDGHGGKEVSKKVSKLLPKIMKKEIKFLKDIKPY